MTTSPQWLQILFDARPDNAGLIADLLSETGALAVTLQDRGDEAIYEPPLGSEPLWSDTCVIGLFDADTDVSGVLQHIQHALQGQDMPACHVKRLANQDWERVWLAHFRPMRFGQRLWICPTAYQPPDPTAVNIMLDPGLAFGTGTHPTTALCLEWLDSHAVTDHHVIDYGCGSGILAIAAARLGARQVAAVDIDHQALLATADNARRNHVDHLIHGYLPADLPAIAADTVLANILAGPLADLAPQLAQLVKPGGSLVLSGLLSPQGPALQGSYRRWFDFIWQQQREDWLCLAARRKE
ncbi:MAG: 50S ribosomal protein L11 methyltransferase [Gammaproteobacteria bacterium]|nr:50S ribosomal protein L11 methyltransferase [Gammaproteobacteria bacterium]